MDRYSHKKQRDLTPEEQKEFEELNLKGYDYLRTAHELWMRQYKEVSNRTESDKGKGSSTSLDANRPGFWPND